MLKIQLHKLHVCHGGNLIFKSPTRHSYIDMPKKWTADDKGPRCYIDITQDEIVFAILASILLYFVCIVLSLLSKANAERLLNDIMNN